MGKSTICWNLGHALGAQDKKVLLVDFDPQCNLSIAVLGEEGFVNNLPQANQPYGTTIRSFLQRFLQNTGGEEVFLHKGRHTSTNVDLVAGDFWLNVYADSLNVGNDLLAGTGLSRYVALRRLVAKAEERAGYKYDFVLVDLPVFWRFSPSVVLFIRLLHCPLHLRQFQRLLRRTYWSNGAGFCR